MRITRRGAGQRLLFLGVLLILAAWAVGAHAVDPEKTPAPGGPASQSSPPAKSDAPAKLPDKRVTFEMRDKPWIGEKGSVLEWLSDQTGMPVSTSNARPTGSLTFISPRENGVPKQYTIPEVIDILNDELFKQKYILVRRAKSFTIIPADEKIDPATLPRVLPGELEQYGNTELVSVVLPLKALVAEDFAKEVQGMLGPFGKVVPLARANKLLVQDTIGNLKRIRALVKEIEDTEKSEGGSFSHSCQYIKARDAEKVLRDLLGDPKELIRALQPPPQFPFARGPVPQSPPVDVSKIRMHYISVDEGSNTVLVTGPADKVAQAAEIIKKIDVPQHRGQKPVLVGPPVIKTYPVPGGNAEALAKNLQEIYKSSSTIRIAAVGNNSIMVYAGPGDQFEILEHIKGAKEQSGAPEVITLTTLDPSDVVETLKGMFGGEPKTGAPYLKADTERNAVVVKGTADQVSEVKLAIKTLEGGGAGATAGTMRVLTIEGGSAAAVAEALRRMLPQLIQNPVNVITPDGTNPNKPEPQKTEPRKTAPPDKSNGKDRRASDRVALAADGPQLVDPQQQPPKNNKPGDKKVPINITAVGNKLIITSDDPKALALTQELVRLLTQQGTQRDFETIRLKNASASDAAKALDEAFNGPRQQTGQPQVGFGGPGGGGLGGFLGRFGAPGAAPPANPRQNTIRVVAFPPTNSLLVWASPLDMLRIRQLLKNAIDTEDTDSKAVIKTWVLKPLQYAQATEVASVIRDVYREQMNNNPVATQVGGFPGFAFGGFRGRGGQPQNLNVDANGNPRGVTLSVGVDDRTNRLVLNCSEALHSEIQRLVDHLDAAAKDARRTVKVISVRGIDPVLVQQAIDAIQGRRTLSRQGTGTITPGVLPLGGGLPPSIIIPSRTPGGGGFPPGGGGVMPGGGPPGGGGPRSSSSSSSGQQRSRGPDFFAPRVTDDPQPSLLYDPRQPTPPSSSPNLGDGRGGDKQSAAPTPRSVRQGAQASESSASSQPIQLTKLQAQQPPTPGPGRDIIGPRAPVTVEALDGVIIISGNNPADVEEVLQIIRYLQELGAGAEVQIQLVPMEHADATSVATTLTQLFRSVIVTTAGNIRSAQPTTTITTPTPTGVPATTTQQQAASVVLLPLPRYNALLVAAPKARMDDILKEIKRLDRPTSPQGRAVPFSLKKASAARVATLLINFYNQRYPNETAAQHQIRITSEDSTNTVFVQAAPADLDEIRDLIERIDNTVSSAVNELRIVPLRNALASDLTTLMVQAISQGIVAPTAAPAAGAVPGAVPGAIPGAVPGAVPGAPGAVPRAAGLLPGAAPTGVVPTAVGAAAQTTGTTKTISLRFISPRPGGPGIVEAGILEDIHITPDVRTNSLIVAAPAKTMDLLLALIRELDVPPRALAEVKVFPLRRADAAVMAGLLQQLFFGTGAVPGPGAPGVPAAPGALPAAAAPAGAITGLPTAQFTVSGVTPEGAPLVELHITVDARTNSLIVAGGRNDLLVIEAIVSRLEDTDIEGRRHEVFCLRNASAADVASALQTFLNNALTVFQKAGQLTSFTEIQRDVVIVAEPISNKLLISATPQYFAEIVRLIHELDAQPPQVVIQVLIAEVDLTATEEFGVELGLQSPVLFSRSIIPAENFLGSGTIGYTNATGGLVPPGVTVTSSINPAAQPGFNFNNVSLPLGNNPVVNPGIVGFQGLGNLGVGRASSSGIGGFVFSAASDTFNLLIRALKTQGRIDVLSRPQIQTTDNQTALINIGQDIPYVTASNITGTGIISNSIQYRSVGVILQVTPKISPDGTVFMRVIPEVSSVAPTQINLGNGQLATAFNVQHVETTVSARDGETVAIGGLISKRDEKHENKIPWVGDLPYVGSLFRFRTQSKSKTELLVILTPHVVRCPVDADRILAEESRRMDWIVGDVVRIHGTTGLEPILAPLPLPSPNLGECKGGRPGLVDQAVPLVLPALPAPAAGLPAPVPVGPAPEETLPPPRTMPQPALPGQQPAPGPQSQSRVSGSPAGSAAPSASPLPAGQPSPTSASPNSGEDRGGGLTPVPPSQSGPPLPPVESPSPTSTEPPQEKRGWSLFRRHW